MGKPEPGAPPPPGALAPAPGAAAAKGGPGQRGFVDLSLQATAAQMAVTLLGAVNVIATARLLGPAGKGALALLVLIPVLATAFLHLGIGQAAVFYAPRHGRGELVASSAALVAGLGLLGAVAALLLALGPLRPLFRGMPSSWIILMGAAVPVALSYDWAAALLQALYRIEARNLMVVVCPAVNLVLLLVLAGPLGLGVAGGLIAWFLAYAASAAFGAARIAAFVPPERPRFDAGLARRLLGFGARGYWGSLLNMLNARFDFLLVGFLLGPAELGLFTVAAYMAELLWKLPEAVAVVLQPRAARLSEDEARRFTPRVLRLLLRLLPIAALLIAAVAAPLVRFVFGPDFRGAVPALLILLPGFVAAAVHKVLASDMMGRGRPLACSGTSILAFLAMVALDLWLIPLYGIRGAALAAAAAYVLGAAVMIALYLRGAGVPLRFLLVAPRGEPGALRDAVRAARSLLPFQRGRGRD
jgi:O-antigen/teichoic acid export membrane protein